MRKQFNLGVLFILSGLLFAGATGAFAAGQDEERGEKVLTPAEAGRIFLRTTGNFKDSALSGSKSMAGRVFTVDFAEGNFRMRHSFDADGRMMTWEILTGEAKGRNGTVPFQAFDVRPGITFIMAQPRGNESAALVVDDNRGMAISFLGRYTIGDVAQPMSLMTVQGPILEAGLAEPLPFERADDLGGTRFTVVYPNEVAIYEHIYLNENYVTWLGHKGTSAGVADTERFEAFKIAPNLYLVAWNEKSAPIQLSFLLDFDKKRELAALFGFDEDKARMVYQRTSADIPMITRSEVGRLK